MKICFKRAQPLINKGAKLLFTKRLRAIVYWEKLTVKFWSVAEIKGQTSGLCIQMRRYWILIFLIWYRGCCRKGELGKSKWKGEVNNLESLWENLDIILHTRYLTCWSYPIELFIPMSNQFWIYSSDSNRIQITCFIILSKSNIKPGFLDVKLLTHFWAVWVPSKRLPTCTESRIEEGLP